MSGSPKSKPLHKSRSAAVLSTRAINTDGAPALPTQKGVLPTREFPNPVAVFDKRFIFTTLTTEDVQKHLVQAYGHPGTGKSCVLFSLDHELGYTSFASDFGPYNIAHTIRGCIRIQEMLTAKRYLGKPLCLFTDPNPAAKVNTLLIACLFMVLVEGRCPWTVYSSAAHMELIMFRDAGNAANEFGLSFQDILYGMEKAVIRGVIDLQTLDLDAYHYYETPQNGDLNILGPFIPFASPQEPSFLKAAKPAASGPVTPSKRADARAPIYNGALDFPKNTAISHAFQCVLNVFKKEDVGVVVRLNDELYDKRHFLDAGIGHVEMYFDDGSNPSDEIVRDFIRIADDVITRKKQKVAVHCKAGLGRTGCLIGAYLIYKHHFSAQEVIAFMRMVRPGMVVGPQQQYLLQNQMKWVTWAAEDKLMASFEKDASARGVCNLPTPPAEPGSSQSYKDRESDVDGAVERSLRPQHSQQEPGSPKRGDAAGQPRKCPPRELTYAEATAPEPEQCHRAERAGRSASESPADHPSSNLAAGSMRGTKRGATRMPRIPSAESSVSALSHATEVSESLQASQLERSSSLASTISEIDRPAKRRPTDPSPLQATDSSASYLSSPPPSRESSPFNANDKTPSARPTHDDFVLVSTPQKAPSTPSRIPVRLRRKPSPAPAVPAPPVLSGVSGTPGRSTAATASSAAKALPPRRSFLRRFGSKDPAPAPHVEKSEAQAPPTPATAALSPSRRLRAAPSMPNLTHRTPIGSRPPMPDLKSPEKVGTPRRTYTALGVRTADSAKEGGIPETPRVKAK